MLVPVYGFVRGDCLGLLVLVHDTDTIAALAASLQQAAATRVAPRERVRVLVRGRVLEPSLTVADAGLTALERVDLVPAPADGATP
jgi:hypothetical protein